MSRIAGVNIPKNKKIYIAITYIYGIGKSSSIDILNELDIDINLRVYDLTENEIRKINNKIEKSYLVEGKLRTKISTDVQFLIENKTYRGSRHLKKLPVRGQRTHTNARTMKCKTIAKNKRK